jgi:hypothetical protein
LGEGTLATAGVLVVVARGAALRDVTTDPLPRAPLAAPRCRTVVFLSLAGAVKREAVVGDVTLGLHGGRGDRAVTGQLVTLEIGGWTGRETVWSSAVFWALTGTFTATTFIAATSLTRLGAKADRIDLSSLSEYSEEGISARDFLDCILNVVIANCMDLFIAEIKRKEESLSHSLVQVVDTANLVSHRFIQDADNHITELRWGLRLDEEDWFLEVCPVLRGE